MLRSKNTLTVGIMLISLGVFVIALIDNKIPDRLQLADVTGQVKSLEKVTSKGGGISAIRFSLSNNHGHFHYVSKSGNIDEVWNFLDQASLSEMNLLFDPADCHSPPFEDRTFCIVYEIRFGDKMIRSYEDVAESWRQDNYVGWVLGIGSVIAGFAALAIYLGKRNQND